MLKGEAATLFFYSPNIYPETEYLKRGEEAEKVAGIYGARFIRGEYDHGGWLKYIKENLPLPPERYRENEARCRACFRYRLERTARFAAENGFKEFAATLSINRFKDTLFIDNYSRLLAEKNGIGYRQFSVDAQEAHREGIMLSKKHAIYRQKYCGCEFSLPGGV